MRRRVLRWSVAVLAVVVLVTLGRKVPEALAGSELFEVDGFALEGARFLTLDEAVTTAAVEPGASIWDDPSAWEARLEAHPLVRRAEVHRRLPGTLVFEVEEEEPVALVPTPVLEPVDGEGHYLPLDPATHRLDLPVVRPLRERGAPERPTEARVRPLARAVERMRRDPVFFGRVSEVSQQRDGSLQVRWGAEPEITFLMSEGADPRRMGEGMRVLAHALEVDRRGVPRAVDLRYADQVVVRY